MYSPAPEVPFHLRRVYQGQPSKMIGFNGLVGFTEVHRVI